MARLREVERAYFVRKVGGAAPTEPLNNIKRRYMVGVIGSGVSAKTSMDQLEKLWLLAVIGTAVPDFGANSELWKLAVSSIGKIPTNYENDNKIIFYLNAP